MSSPSTGKGALANSEDGDERDTMQITEEDAAFILGKGGRTKMKLARVSGCTIELLENDLKLEFRGTEKQRRQARRYARCVMAQRTGPVHVDANDVADDCTVVAVPQEAVGFVTGRGGNFLRTMEDEHIVIMFFADIEGYTKSEAHEDLVIFGGLRGRRSAQLSVMSVVETKIPEYYTKAWRETGETFDQEEKNNDWGTSTMEFNEDEVSYALGRQGTTRRKIARASGCIVQYVNRVAFMSGTKTERTAAREYIKWLFEQLEGPVYVDTDSRPDCTVVNVPADCIGYVTGNHRETLGAIEETYGTLMFFVEKRGNDKEGGPEKLAIFGSQRARRGAELTVMSSVEKKSPGYFTRGVRDKESPSLLFDTDRMTMPDDNSLSYALGRDGSTRKKIATASNAVLQFVGKIAFIAGDLQERRRCRDYLCWLLDQRDGKVSVDVRNRDDITEVHVPEGFAGSLMGNHGSELRQIEQQSGTFCFMAHDPQGADRLLICGHEEGSTYGDTGRIKAEKLAKYLIQDKRRKDNGSSRHSHARGGWQRSRSRPPHWSRDHGSSPPRQGANFGNDGWQPSRDHGSSKSSWQSSCRAQPPRPPQPPHTGDKSRRSPTPPWRKPDAFGSSGSARGSRRW